MRTQQLVRMLVVAVFGLINLRVAGAQLPTDVRKQMWSAQWITSPEGPQRDQSVLPFRKFIELAQQPEHFTLKLSADNQFILYVIKQLVGFGPSRGDLGNWSFQPYASRRFFLPAE